MQKLKTLWEKENPGEPFCCFQVGTDGGIRYFKAKRAEDAEALFLKNAGAEFEERYEIGALTDKSELAKKRFFVGESGDEEDESAWASLDDFMAREWQPHQFIKDEEPAQFLAWEEKG